MLRVMCVWVWLGSTPPLVLTLKITISYRFLWKDCLLQVSCWVVFGSVWRRYDTCLSVNMQDRSVIDALLLWRRRDRVPLPFYRAAYWKQRFLPQNLFYSHPATLLEPLWERLVSIRARSAYSSKRNVSPMQRRKAECMLSLDSAFPIESWEHCAGIAGLDGHRFIAVQRYE